MDCQKIGRRYNWHSIKTTLQEIVADKKLIIAEKKDANKKCICEEVPSLANFEMVVGMMDGFEKEWRDED